MSTKSKLIEILTENHDRFISGQELAATLGVSRNAVWKAVNSLKDAGFDIKALPSTGYKLISLNDVLSADVISTGLKHDFAIHVLGKVNSTNNYARSLTSGKPVLVLADSQTSGRGRKGRSFYSPKGAGLYMSISFKPEFDIKRSMLVTSMAALACCHAINKVTGLNPKIKWVNDIYLDDKKVGGILTEASTSVESGSIDNMTIGIGINCFECKMPEDIANITTYLKDPARPFSRNQLAAEIVNSFMEILNNFSDRQIVLECSSRSNILGQDILVYNPAIAREIGRPQSRLNDGIRARAIDIDDNGGLVVEFFEGKYSHMMMTLTSGEVTIRKSDR